MASDYYRNRATKVRMTQLHKTLSEAVRSSEMTYQDMADATGMARSTISEMVNGRVRGSLESWQKLLDATGVVIRWE